MSRPSLTQSYNRETALPFPLASAPVRVYYIQCHLNLSALHVASACFLLASVAPAVMLCSFMGRSVYKRYISIQSHVSIMIQKIIRALVNLWHSGDETRHVRLVLCSLAAMRPATLIVIIFCRQCVLYKRSSTGFTAPPCSRSDIALICIASLLQPMCCHLKSYTTMQRLYTPMRARICSLYVLLGWCAHTLLSPQVQLPKYSPAIPYLIFPRISGHIHNSMLSLPFFRMSISISRSSIGLRNAIRTAHVFTITL